MIAVGPGKYTENGNLIPCSVKKGDRFDRFILFTVECLFLVSVETISRSTMRITWSLTTMIFWVFSNKYTLLVGEIVCSHTFVHF